MRHASLLLALALPGSALAADLSASDTWAGSTLDVELTGATPGDYVQLVGSIAGEGAGPCPAFLAGDCLDLLPRLFVLGRARADALGAVHWSVPVPARAPTSTIWLQAIYGTPGSVLLSPTASALVWGDADRDGSFDDVDCDPADPAVHPGATQRNGDGEDSDCDGYDAVNILPVLATSLAPDPASAGDTLTALVEVTDSDPVTTPITLQYRWSVNGTFLTGQVGSTFATAGVAGAGDVVEVEVRADDTRGVTDWVSDSVVLQP